MLVQIGSATWPRSHQQECSYCANPIICYKSISYDDFRKIEQGLDKL
jgi:hypothetical protein